jgi:hypothetical protein
LELVNGGPVTIIPRPWEGQRRTLTLSRVSGSSRFSAASEEEDRWT